MAHIVLPSSDGNKSSPGKFADTAVEHLRTALLGKGAKRFALQAKIAGGAKMFNTLKSEHIGSRNLAAVLECLEEWKIRVVSRHIGGKTGRVVRFSLVDGSMTVMVRREIVEVI